MKSKLAMTSIIALAAIVALVMPSAMAEPGEDRANYHELVPKLRFLL